MKNAKSTKDAISDAIDFYDMYQMTAEEYLENLARINRAADFERAKHQYEMSAEEYRRTHGKTANDVLRNLDSSNVDTETPAKVDFAEWLHAVSPAPVVTEYVFLRDRKYRADWAIPSLGIVFEYDGRTHHATVSGSERDAEKSNLAQLAGWLFIRVNAASLKDGTGYVIAQLAINQRVLKLRR